VLERWARVPELRRMAIALLVVAGVWGFFEIADEVGEGGTDSFDALVLESLRRSDEPGVPIGPRWLAASAVEVTALGSSTVLLLAIAAVAGFLALVRERVLIALVLVSGIGAMLLAWGLKAAFARARPDLVPHLTDDWAYASFPSGHAMASAAVYLSLGLLVARTRTRRIEKTYLVACAMLLALLVGSTRVYLGVHYPTDVLAGWLGGIAWALACGIAAEWIDRRRRGRGAQESV